MNHFDAIIIGSGMGGLTTASLLAQLKGRKVLVLEKHSKLGGYTHTFKRQAKYKWDVGLHYVGDMAPGQHSRQLMDFVTDGRVEWAPQPDAYDVFSYPGFTVRLKKGREGFLRSFEEVFPGERKSLEAYLEACRSVIQGNALLTMDAMLPQPLRPVLHHLPLRGIRLAKQTTAQVLERIIPNPHLRSALASQWGDYGLPPSQSAFLIHAIVAIHYLDGGYYPVGGSNRLAEEVKAVVEERGGELRTRAEVEKILLNSKGRAHGVRLKDGTEVFAPVVVSDAGARLTYLSLLPEGVAPRVRERLAQYGEGISSATLFLGLKENPAKLGVQGENYWLFDREDHDEIYSLRDGLVDGRISLAYVSFPSLKDPQSTEHMVEVVLPTDFQAFEGWCHQPVKRRDEAYRALKRRIAEATLDFVETRIPGLKALVDHVELATPLTNLHYCAHPGGAIYGVPATPQRFFEPWARPRTPVPGLYLTGADAMAHGIVGAMMGGVLSIGAIEGFRTLIEIFGRLGKTARPSNARGKGLSPAA